MKDVFERTDKYKDYILKRSDLLMALRTDDLVVDFVDVDAVRCRDARRTVLTLDQILVEVERDEIYEQQLQPKNQASVLNHKLYISWREFLSYFEDYQPIEIRNKHLSKLEVAKDNLQKAKNPAQQEDPQQEFKTLMQSEIERRCAELPKMRLADQIDCTEEQLQELKDAFDRAKTGNQIDAVSFFLQTRKNPKLKAMANAVARDPEGCSRIAKETFAQVWDRMESDLKGKMFGWPTIVEYFTKRGHPLSKEDMLHLQQEDQRIQE